ncbi:MAG: hypothetical protein M1834_008970 [Cirrosporium novae-zelandiae]|nr:MAG: hypothetical protein M1834_008970 [Cirrosporium novae-zelandiae]
MNFSKIFRKGQPPYLLKLRSSKAVIVSTVGLAVFTDVFLYGIIVPVLPYAISTRAGIPLDNRQHWISALLACYGAALFATSPICGMVADHTSSRQAPFLVGLLAIAGSTVMLCVGNSIAILVIGRILQGASASFVWVIGLALLVDTVEQNEIGQMMGYVSACMSVGILIAPLLGGVVYAKAGYIQTFAMAFAVIGLDILLRLFLIEKKIAKRWEVVSEAQSAADCVTSTPQTLTLQAENEPRSGIKKLLPSRVPPILTLLTSPRLIVALWGSFVQATLMTAFDSVVPLFAQSTFGFSSIGSSLLFLAITITSFLAPISGFLSDRYGPRLLTAASFALCTPFLVLLRLVDHDSVRQIVLLCALLALIGAALALGFSPIMAEINASVEERERERPGANGMKGAIAQAYALYNMAFALGTMIGPIWAGYVRDSAGWGTMSWSLGLLSGVTTVPVLLYTGGTLWKVKKVEQQEPIIEPEMDHAEGPRDEVNPTEGKVEANV